MVGVLLPLVVAASGCHQVAPFRSEGGADAQGVATDAGSLDTGSTGARDSGVDDGGAGDGQRDAAGPDVGQPYACVLPPVTADGPAALAAAGFVWRNPQPVSHELKGMWADPDTSEIWAVGGGGTVAFFDNTRWRSVSGCARGTLQAVWGTATEDVWAVGAHGAILRFDGVGWRQLPSPTTEHLRGVWVAPGATDGWAVGDGPTLLRYQGGSWQLAELPQMTVTPAALHDVHGYADRVVAVGDNGTVLGHVGDGPWKLERAPRSLGSPLRGCWAGPGLNYAVGLDGLLRSTDGDSWEEFWLDAMKFPSPRDWRAVRGGGGRVVVAGASTTKLSPVFEEGVAGFTPLDVGSTRAGVQAVAVTAQRRVWMGGVQRFRIGSDTDGVISWLETGPAGRFESAWCPGPGRMEAIPAARDYGLRFDLSVSKQPQPRPEESPPVVSSWGDAVRITAITTGPSFQLRTKTEGDSFYVDYGAPGHVSAIWGDARGLWTIGKAELGHRTSAGEWANPVPAPFLGNGIWGTPEGDLWIVGEHASPPHQRVIAAWNGDSFKSYDSGVLPLNAIHGTSDKAVWAVGESGAIARRQGEVWRVVPPGEVPTSEELLTVWAPAVDEVWAAGRNGTLLRFDGSRWEPIEPGVEADLHHICGSESDIWIVGDNGVVLWRPR